MSQDIYILGAGGLAREVAYLIQAINQAAPEPLFTIQGFVDVDPDKVGEEVGPYRIVSTEVDLLQRTGVAVAIGIGDPRILRKLAARLPQHPGLSFPNLVHPAATADWKRITLGQGNVICAGVALTTDITLGSFNLLNLNTTVGHDTVFGDGCVVNPGANISGGVVVGDGVLVGTGATVLQYRSIGEGAVVGASAVVTKDVQPGVVVVGSPAKPLPKK